MVAAMSKSEDLDDGSRTIEVTLFIVSPWVEHSLSPKHHQEAQRGNTGISSTHSLSWCWMGMDGLLFSQERFRVAIVQ